MANETVLDESAMQAPTFVGHSTIPQDQYHGSSEDSKYTSGVAKAPLATATSKRLHDSHEDLEAKAKKQTSSSAEVTEADNSCTGDDSDMDKKPAAKPETEKGNLLDSSEEEVGAEKKGAGRKRKDRRVGESSDSTSQGTSISQKLMKRKVAMKR